MEKTEQENTVLVIKFVKHSRERYKALLKYLNHRRIAIADSWSTTPCPSFQRGIKKDQNTKLQKASTRVDISASAALMSLYSFNK